jgi:hypothetical protein
LQAPTEQTDGQAALQPRQPTSHEQAFSQSTPAEHELRPHAILAAPVPHVTPPWHAKDAIGVE